MARENTLTGWQTARSWIVEGVFLLARMLPVTAEAVLLTVGTEKALPFPQNGWEFAVLLVVAGLQGALLSPLRVARVLWYRELAQGQETLPSLRPIARGWRCWRQAVAWRWHLWWRHTVLTAAAAVPACLLWHVGENAAQPILWLIGGWLAVIGGWVAVQIYLCRYLLTPLWLAEGYPALAAMQFSARAMRRRIGEYLNFLGGEGRDLILCAAVIPAVWAAPRFRLRQTARMLAWYDEWYAAGQKVPGGYCNLRRKPI